MKGAAKMQWKLIELRKKSGLTQPDMARLLGLNVNTYGKKERGQIEFKLSEVIAIHKLFNFTIEEIFLNNNIILNDVKGVKSSENDVDDAKTI